MRRLLVLTAVCCVSAIAISCMSGKGGNRGIPNDNEPNENTKTPPENGGDTTSQTTNAQIDLHPVVNVYMENSGSMNGYVDRGRTEFQQAVYNFLCDVKISQIPSAINMNFINSQIIPKGSVIDDFINKLTPNDFRTSAGNHGTTDIADVLKQVLARTDDNTVSIFISDCIFSPGNIKSPEAYLANQQVGIKECVADYLSEHTNLAVMVYQMKSKFNGIYYDYQNRRHNFDGERPYYIWIIGHPLHIANLRSNIPDDRFMGGISNYWCCYSSDKELDVSYSILPNPKKGEFRLNDNHTISRAKTDKNNEFMFTVGIKYGLHRLLLGEDYLLDTDNYARMINKSVKEDIYIDISENLINASPATHNISLCTKGYVPKGDLEIALCCKTPDWCYEMTDFDDSVFTENNIHKTYGLQYMFDGIQQAFTARKSNNYLIMNFNAI